MSRHMSGKKVPLLAFSIILLVIFELKIFGNNFTHFFGNQSSLDFSFKLECLRI